MGSRAQKLVALALECNTDSNDTENVPINSNDIDIENVPVNYNEIDIENVPIIFDSNNDLFELETTNFEEFTLEEDCSNNNNIISFSNCCTDVDNNLNIVVHNSDEFETDIEIENQQLASSNNFKIVDYSSSSDTSDATTESDKNTVTKNNPIKLQDRRNSSDYSFYSDKTNNSDCDSLSPEELQNDEDTVGENGMRKKRKLNQRLEKKLKKNLGSKRCVQPNPCKKNCQHQCTEKFSETTRHNIFDFYWGLSSYQRQRDWLLSCTKEVDIKRRTQDASTSRRQKSFKYCIPWEERETEVCQQFLLKTLNISQMTLRYTKSNCVTSKCSKTDQRGKREPVNKTTSVQIKHVHDFIKKLPAVPSHYCRNKTSRKYLPQEFRNISTLYRIFKAEQTKIMQNSEEIVSLRIFRNIFKRDFNLGFHLPKKDKCLVCEVRKDKEFQETEKSLAEFEEHTKNKSIAKELFLADQQKYLQDSTFLCASFDLQKVLNTPHGDNMLLYYSRKYSYYNETIYESGTHRGFCYLWGDVDGNRGSSEICSVIYNYLKNVDERKTIKSVALYCDSCSGQNKNKAMLCMLKHFISQSSTIENIKIVYLLPGHTYMPVDSVHATIEKFIKNRIIWAPSEWSTVIGNARVKPNALEVIKMTYSDFVDWKSAGDQYIQVKNIKISKLKAAYFEKEKVMVNYTYEDKHFETLLPIIKAANVRKSRRVRQSQECVINTPGLLYSQPLPISEAKKTDLYKLCITGVIPARYKTEYLKMRCSEDIDDVLPETDEEDIKTFVDE